MKRNLARMILSQQSLLLFLITLSELKILKYKIISILYHILERNFYEIRRKHPQLQIS